MLIDINKSDQFFGYENLEDYNETLNSETALSYDDDPKKRRERLENAPKIPAKTQMTTTQYRRNPDVIAEVLYRANGICECCHKKAPFISKSTGRPYLEVHHIIQLSKHGEDSVENAIAVCPNCHKKLHFGQ